MGNTLRVVLILIGSLMIGYGLYLWISPEVNALEFIQSEKENRNSQLFAMIAFGILMLISGIAYKRR